MFGVGPYTFAPFKVAVSAMHREAVFRVLRPVDGRPVAVDDTCYLATFEHEADAEAFAEAMNRPDVQRFIGAISQPGAKRVVTKRLLQRVEPGWASSQETPL